MYFMQLLKSLDELLYEVMSWLVFFPLTLWRTLMRPIRMMEYADTELQDPEAQQYEDALSPPLFLLLSILLTQALDMSVNSSTNAFIQDQRGLARLIQDDTSLLLLRLVVFSLIPMTLAVSQVGGKNQRMTRRGLKAPFYAQCYPVAALSLAVGSSATVLSSEGTGTIKLVATVVIPLSLALFLALEVKWMRHRLHCGWGKAAGRAVAGFGVGLVAAIGIALLFL